MAALQRPQLRLGKAQLARGRVPKSVEQGEPGLLTLRHGHGLAAAWHTVRVWSIVSMHLLPFCSPFSLSPPPL